MSNHPGIFSDNEWSPGTGPEFHSINPATGETLWSGHAASLDEVNMTVQNAWEAFSDWSNLPIDERAVFLNAFAKTVNAESTELAEIISKETGKALWDSKTEVKAMVDKVWISIKSYGSRCAGILNDVNPAVRNITRHRPHGVIAVLGPFNFPGHLSGGQIVPALLAGNTVVYKPSELTPLVAETLMKCWKKAGLPKGVLNLVQGGPETGQSLAKNPSINGLFFIGSHKTGQWLAETLGPQIEKILVLEMGGNNPLIIGDVDDAKLAAYLTIQSAYVSSGQRCTCARRLIVPRGSREDRFIQILTEMTNCIIVGPYDAIPEPYMGPVIREAHALKFLEAQAQLAARGGEILLEMRQIKKGTGFLTPGLMDVTAVRNRPDEEIFGPFLQVIRVENLDEAVKEANQTQFGLAAGIITDRKKEHDFFYANSRAGVLNWNTPLTGASSEAPFGGIRSSGNFRPNAYYSADYCSYPVTSMEATKPTGPTQKPPGLNFSLTQEP
jgi:succinylglutamic semialdehyde dehydrogenase